MRLLRHRLLQRFVALLLVAGVGTGALPVASASVPTGAHGLDAGALGAARGAARQAPTREAAADAFVATYVRITGDSATREALYRLLLDDAIGGVPPAAPPDAVFSAAPPASTTPAPSLAGVLPSVLRVATDSARLARPVGLSTEAPLSVTIRTASARAP